MARGQGREVGAAELLAMRDTVLWLQAALRDGCEVGPGHDRERLLMTLGRVLGDFDEMIGRRARALFPGLDDAGKAS
jgi:hypothetical protein